MQKILTVANYKTLKGRSFGYETFGIHFAPANISGYEVCQGRSKGCTDSCLNLAGMGVMVQPQRIEKTKSFFEEQALFMDNLIKEIETGIKSAAKKSLQAVFRLNLTSDIRWEDIIHKGKNIFQHFSGVQFYDYIKLFDRLDLTISNYHLTFSRAETKVSQVKSFAALAKGNNSAFVFSTKKDQPLPTEHEGFKVIDGDENDLRFLDPKNAIVGLRAKGPAKKDNSGFVIHV
jgi:hypothetical protein